MDTNKLQEIDDKINRLEVKINLILELLQKEVHPNCQKMGNHIDFVENVYDNVKNPLGFNKSSNILSPFIGSFI